MTWTGVLSPVHTGESRVAGNGNNLSPNWATVAEFGDKSPSPKSVTIVASVDRALGYVHRGVSLRLCIFLYCLLIDLANNTAHSNAHVDLFSVVHSVKF